MPLKDKKSLAAYQREYYHRRCRSDPEYKRRLLARSARNNKRKEQALQELVTEFRRNGCLLCSENTPCCLVGHHLDPATKEFCLATGVRHKISISRMVAEIAKCVCLCQNCHLKLHAGLLSLPTDGG